MRRLPYLILPLLLIGLCAAGVRAAEPPRREATWVEDVFAANTVPWFISPAEEAEGDIVRGYEPEYDIVGVIASQDRDYLRLDLVVAGPIDTEIKFVEWNEFGFNITMAERSWDYIYTPPLEEFQRIEYLEPKNEVIYFEEGRSNHQAGLVRDGKCVYFILDKKEFAGGRTGRQTELIFFFTDYVRFSSDNYDVQEVDYTMEVLLEYDV